MDEFYTQQFGKEAVEAAKPTEGNRAFASLFTGVYNSANAIFRIALMVAVVVAIVMFVIYGVMYATASKGQQHDMAKQRIMRGVLAVGALALVSSGVLLIFNILWS